MAKALTPKSIEALKAGPTRREIADPGLSGLYLVLQPSGARSWALRYRFGGRPAKLTLGRWPGLGLAGARAAASDALAKVEAGVDPGAEKKARKAAEKAAKAAEGEPDRDSVQALVRQYHKRHLRDIKSGAQALAFLERFVVRDGAKVMGRPKGGWETVPFRWGERTIHSIIRRDVRELLDEIKDSGRATTANRVRAHLSGFLNWCVSRDILEASPLAGVKQPARERARDRVLSDPEIVWFWTACERLGAPWGAFGQVLLLTGQRLNEVARMTDGEIDGDTWHLPAERVKNAKPHSVPLSDPVQSILASVPRIVPKEGRAPGFVFSTTGNAPIGDFSRARKLILNGMTELANEGLPDGTEPIVVEPWGFHDLRRTFATGCIRLRVPVDVVESVLNHMSGAKSGVAGVYNRHHYDDEKREALTVWAGFVQRLVDGGGAGNVVRLPSAEARQ